MSWKSPFAIKQIEDPGGGELLSKRRQRWQSTIEDLQEECYDFDDGEVAQKIETAVQPQPAVDEGSGASDPQAVSSSNQMEPSSSHWDNPGSINSLYLQQLRENTFVGRYYGHEAQANLRNLKAPQPRILPSTMPLREWVAYHAGIADEMAPCYKKIDKGYLEKSTRVALSLAKKLEAYYGPDSNVMVNCEDIIIDRIVIVNTHSGDVDFSPLGSLSNYSTQLHQTRDNQRTAIFALGRVYYEMFTQGLLPQITKEEPIASTSPSEKSSFDVALNITEDDVKYDGEHPNKRKQPRTEPLGGRVIDGHYATLQRAGLPPSLCRLVADMLENYESGGLFLSDSSLASFSDAVCDLQQMVDDPNSFLHDALLFRLEPVVPDKLYGRKDELNQCLEVADAFCQNEANSIELNRSQSAIMVSGFSGCGKSSLMKEVGTRLEKKGWRCLHCKFNQEVRPQPLSTIASAFGHFLEDLEGRVDTEQEVKASIANAFDNAKIGTKAHHTLVQLIPSLRRLVPAKDICSHPSGILVDSRGADAAKCHLHQLFLLLLRALSDPAHPLLLCLDDLQWADIASLELITFLMEGIEEVNKEKIDDEEGWSHSMLLFGCFRSNEVADSVPLDACIQQMRNCSAIELNEIHLEGLTSEDVNALVSDSLFYPRRLTRSLSNLIHQKSAGNTLYVKEFLNSLATESLLIYSLSKHKWQFDEDIIQLKTVSEDVADLLTRRLQRLPKGVLSVLQLMSCFGSDVSLEVMVCVRNICGNSDITKSLDRATKELLVKIKSNGSYSFVHDMIQQTVYQGMEQTKRMQMLKQVADTLSYATTESRTDAILFTIVDLINRVGPKNTHDNENRAVYASFNLSAGEKSMKIPDIESAQVYLESGISFLEDGCWTQNYNLSLALFKNASLAHWTLGKTHLMTKRIDQLLDNARCYEDKLDSMSVMIQSYAYSGSSAEKGFDLCFSVLEKLGESFPKSLEDVYIKKELTATSKQLQELLSTSLDSLPVMENGQKLQAMKFLYIAGTMCWAMKSRYFPIVSSRLVKLTMEYGLSEYSALGLSWMAVSFASLLQDVSEGYKLGKLVKRLNKSSKLIAAQADTHVLAMINVWKEPIQSVLPLLLDCHKIAMRGGDVTAACNAAVFYILRAFFFGSALTSLSKEAAVFLRIMSRFKRIINYKYVATIANAIASMTGAECLVNESVEGPESDESNLINAFNKKHIVHADTIATKEIMTNFILRRMDATERLVRQYACFFELQKLAQPGNTVMRSFYSGLTAFHFLRQSQDQYWEGIGQNAIQNFENWMKSCEWNFENKLLLLKAEHYFVLQEMEAARDCYQLSIASAKKHRFIHEEAIACELASLFHLSNGDKDLSGDLLKRSVACYQQWGAVKKVSALSSSIE